MIKKIKAGILGTGSMGQTHAINLRKIEGVEIVAVCATTMEKAKDFSTNFTNGNAEAYDCFDTLLKETSLDVLYVCIPPFAHNGQVEKAAENGINVFIEKPIALDTIRGASMLKAIKKAEVKSQVGYHMRFGHAVKELKRLIDNGKAGIPTLLSGRYECNSLHSPWWIDKKKSGGQIFEQIIHTYDMAIYMLGEPELASGFANNLCHKEVAEYSIEDTSTASVRFKTGALANISGSNCSVPMEWNNPFTIVCQNLTAFFSNPNKAEFVFNHGENCVRSIVEGESDMYMEETNAFIAAVRGEAENICTIEDGYKSLRLVEAVVKSAENNGDPVKYINTSELIYQN